MLSERDKPKLELDVVDEQIDTVGRAFLGLTLGCARCHDHKFDPVPNEDYYALAGIFKSTHHTERRKPEICQHVESGQAAHVGRTSGRPGRTRNATDSRSNRNSRQAEQRLKTAKEKSPLRGIVVDDADAQKTGNWKPSTHFKHFIGAGYVHDDNKNKGKASIRFAAQLPKSGRLRSPHRLLTLVRPRLGRPGHDRNGSGARSTPNWISDKSPSLRFGLRWEHSSSTPTSGRRDDPQRRDQTAM